MLATVDKEWKLIQAEVGVKVGRKISLTANWNLETDIFINCSSRTVWDQNTAENISIDQSHGEYGHVQLCRDLESFT